MENYKYETVMLLDDSRIDNILNKKMLEVEKIARNIIVHTNVNDALNALKTLVRNNVAEQEIPSLIFVDLKMPEKGGIEFIEEFIGLKSLFTKKIEIIILSSKLYTEEEQFHLKNVLPVFTYMVKPLDKKKLKEVLISL